MRQYLTRIMITVIFIFICIPYTNSKQQCKSIEAISSNFLDIRADTSEYEHYDLQRLCPSTVCCNRSMRDRLIHHLSHNFKSWIADHCNNAIRTISVQLFKLQAFHMAIVNKSRAILSYGFSSHIDDLPLNSHDVVDNLFDIISQSLSDGKIGQRLGSLFERVFLNLYFAKTKQNPHSIREDYQECVAQKVMREYRRNHTETRNFIKQLETAVLRAFALQESFQTLNWILHRIQTEIKPSSFCLSHLFHLTHCSKCQGRKHFPCVAYCHQVMENCLAPLDSFYTQWELYVAEVIKLLDEDVEYASSGYHFLEVMMNLFGDFAVVTEQFYRANQTQFLPQVQNLIDRKCGHIKKDRRIHKKHDNYRHRVDTTHPDLQFMSSKHVKKHFTHLRRTILRQKAFLKSLDYRLCRSVRTSSDNCTKSHISRSGSQRFNESLQFMDLSRHIEYLTNALRLGDLELLELAATDLSTQPEYEVDVEEGSAWLDEESDTSHTRTPSHPTAPLDDDIYVATDTPSTQKVPAVKELEEVAPSSVYLLRISLPILLFSVVVWHAVS